MRRYEKMAQEHKKAKDLADGETPYHVKIGVPSIGIDVEITCLDACDSMILSGRVLETLKYILKKEPQCVVLP
jgi:hypothetical protein